MRGLILVLVILFLQSGPLAVAGDEWIYRAQVNAMDDSVTHVASVWQQFPKYSLSIYCQGRGLTTAVGFNEYLGSDQLTVRYRIDKSAANEELWRVFPKGDTVSKRGYTGLAKRLVTGSDLLFEVFDSRNVGHRVNFPLNGSSEAIKPVLEACGLD